MSEKNRQTAFDCGAPIRTPAVLRSASDVERPKLDHVKVQEEEQIYHNRQPTSQERDLQHPYNVYNCLSNAARSKPEEPCAAEQGIYASASAAAQVNHHAAYCAMKGYCAALKHR